MTTTAMDGLKRLATGAGLVVLVFWTLAAFAPPIDMLYGENGTNVWVNTAFALSGPIPIFGTLYFGRLLMVPDARTGFDAWMKAKLPVFIGFGAIWITVYGLV